MENKTKALMLLFLLILTGCSIDKSNAIKLCKDKGLDYYKTDIGCDIVCINLETSEKHTYDGTCKANVQFNGG